MLCKVRCPAYDHTCCSDASSVAAGKLEETVAGPQPFQQVEALCATASGLNLLREEEPIAGTPSSKRDLQLKSTCGRFLSKYEQHAKIFGCVLRLPAVATA